MSVSKPDIGLEQRVEIIREFNRMYMQRIGMLSEHIFGSAFTPAEIRILNELSIKRPTTASVLSRDLGMDGGYLSRILNGFERKGLISKQKSKEDARQRLILLTKKGRKESDGVLEEARRIMMGIVAPLPVEEQIRLVAAMSTIDRIINGGVGMNNPRVQAPFTLRPHRLGDIGLVIHSHVVQCAADYGWNEEFEALVAEEAGKFIRNFDPACERGWVAEIDGRLMGSIFLKKKVEEKGAGCICLLYVMPVARGMGIGVSLLNELLRFARHAGYKKLVMETESAPDFLRALLKNAGLKLASETPHHRFGKDQLGQIWEMALSPEKPAAETPE
ncbi:MAG: GNAT family N-acetyltransferase [Alphaproteobacteria bacterium]|nr:GNAT family N-acetyltransferase [Alphaproteobacteria bacterium]